MPVIHIEAGQEKQFPVSKRYLNVMALSGVTEIRATDDAWRQTIKTNWTLDLKDVPQIIVVNNTSEKLTVDLESSPFPILGGGSNGVEITNQPVIQRIAEPIQVNANATVNDGAMKSLTANQSGYAEITLSAGETKLLFAAKSLPNRKVTVQTLSDTKTDVVVGSVPAMTAKSGVLLSGSKNAIASLQRDTEQAVYVRNNSDVTAVISGFEEWRE